MYEFDTDARVFRYPCNNDMQVYFKKNVTLDFMNVAEFMESLIRYLCAAVDKEKYYVSDYAGVFRTV